MKETYRRKQKTFTIEEIIKLSWKFARDQGRKIEDTKIFVNETLESLGVEERISTDYRVNVMLNGEILLVN